MEAAERTAKGYTPSRATSPATGQGWRDTDWFKTCVPDQTQKRPHRIQSANRSAPSTLHQRTRSTQSHFHVYGWATRPMETQNPAGGFWSENGDFRQPGVVFVEYDRANRYSHLLSSLEIVYRRSPLKSKFSQDLVLSSEATSPFK